MSFKDLKTSILNKGNSISASVKDYSNKSQLNNDIARTEAEINEEYKKLGFLFYRKLTISEPCEEEIAEIEEIKNRISEKMQYISNKQAEISSIEAISAERKAAEAKEKARREEEKAAEKARREEERENARKLAEPIEAQYENVSTETICIKCGGKINKDSRFCPLCGAKQNNIICPSCGSIVKEGIFCMKCGARLQPIEQKTETDIITEQEEIKETDIVADEVQKDNQTDTTIQEEEINIETPIVESE